jgi:predicted GNAT family N-acyltransferase
VTEQLKCVPLLDKHYTDYFSCGHNDDLDKWLDKRALADQNLGRSATHVWTDAGDCVVAYFTLLQTTIRESDDSIFSRIRPKGFPRDHELPGILIGKLALDRSLQGQGRGLDLVAEAYFTSCEAVTLIGGAVLVVDPMNSKVSEMYQEFGFNYIEGTDRMVLNFREFNKGTPVA